MMTKTGHDVPMGTAIAEKTIVSMAEVRAWAMKKGLDVNVSGNVPGLVIEAFNKAHRTRQFERRPARGYETR
jgi:hypothetical protein